MECRNCWAKVPAGAPACPRCGAKVRGASAQSRSAKLDAETKAQFLKAGLGAAGALAGLWLLGALFGGGAKKGAVADAEIPLSVPSDSPSHAVPSASEEESGFPPLPPPVAAAVESQPEVRPAAAPSSDILATRPGAERPDGTFDGSGMKAFAESRMPR